MKEEIPHKDEVEEVKMGDKIKYLDYFVYEPKQSDWIDGEFVEHDHSYGCELEHGEHSHLWIVDKDGERVPKCEHEIMKQKYYIITKNDRKMYFDTFKKF